MGLRNGATTLSIMTSGRTTVRITSHSVTTLSVVVLIGTLSMMLLVLCWVSHIYGVLGGCCYAESRGASRMCVRSKLVERSFFWPEAAGVIFLSLPTPPPLSFLPYYISLSPFDHHSLSVSFFRFFLFLTHPLFFFLSSFSNTVCLPILLSLFLSLPLSRSYFLYASISFYLSLSLLFCFSLFLSFSLCHQSHVPLCVFPFLLFHFNLSVPSLSLSPTISCNEQAGCVANFVTLQSLQLGRSGVHSTSQCNFS